MDLTGRQTYYLIVLLFATYLGLVSLAQLQTLVSPSLHAGAEHVPLVAGAIGAGFLVIAPELVRRRLRGSWAHWNHEGPLLPTGQLLVFTSALLGQTTAPFFVRLMVSFFGAAVMAAGLAVEGHKQS